MDSLALFALMLAFGALGYVLGHRNGYQKGRGDSIGYTRSVVVGDHEG